MAQRSKSLLALARAVSLIGHPFLLIPAVVLAVSARRGALGPGLGTVAVVAILAVVPLALYIRREVRAGRWSNYDVSIQAQRPRLFVIAFLLTALTTGILLALQQPRAVIHGAIACAAMIAIAGVMNRFVKVSLHTAFSFFAAVIFVHLFDRLGWIAVAAAVVIAGSRLVLRRHTITEVLAGAALGMAIGFLLVRA